jgi:hypothetical protein
MKKLLLTLLILIVTALFTVEINFDNNTFPKSESVVVKVVDAEAQTCPTCPDPDDLELTLRDCPLGYLSLVCLPSGAGCDVGSQIPCPVPEEN